MSVRITRRWPGRRSGYDQTNPLPPTRKSKPSLSISSTCGKASARRRTSSASAIPSVLVDDDAADVLAGQQVVVALVDLVQGVGPGDELVQLQLAVPVQPEELRDVVGRVAVTAQAALHALAPQGEDGPRQVDGRL